MAECSYISKPGHPRLPVKTVVLKLPFYSNVSEVAVDIKDTSFLNVSKPVSPAPAPVPLCINETYDSAHSSDEVQPDSTIYNASELYPKDWFSYSLKKGLDSDTSKRVQYVIVWLYPVRYLPPAKEIVLVEEASVVVYYEDLPKVRSASSELENLIITSPTLEDEAVRLAAFKNSTGILSRVVNTLWIYIHYPGLDRPEQIRNCIEDFVSQYNILYVTIFGDADQVPVRYAYVPDPHETYVATDLYYADLDGTWDDNRDGLYADLRYDNVDGMPDVYVGRIPPSLVEYAEVAVNKIVNFTQNFNRGYEWANRIVLAAGTGDGLGSATTVLKEYIAHMISDMSVVKLYESSGNLTNANLKSKINDGCLFLNFAGHGSPDSWLLRWIIWPIWSEGFSGSDAFSLANGLKLPIVTTMSCSTARFDDAECIGEYFVLNPCGGSTAYFGATRIAWGYKDEWAPYGLMGEMDWRIYEAFYDGYTELGKMWGFSITRYIQRNGLDWLYDYGYLDEKTVMEFVLLGDPTLSVRAESVYARTYLPHEWVLGGVAMGWHADDNSWSYTLPFDFPFYDTYYNTIYVSSNGLITFISPDTSYSNSVPALAGKLAIAPAWDDWVTHAPYDIYIWQPDPDCVTVRWEIRAYGSSIIANFEAILDIDGVIQFNYEYSNGTVSATVGISNGAGDILAESVTNLNYINTIVFTPPPTRRARIYIDPEDSIFYTDTTFVGDQFNVSIMAADWKAPGVYAYEFKLYYNNTLLEAVATEIPADHWLKPSISPGNILIADPGTINQTAGYVSFAVTLIDAEPGKTGGGTVSTVTFQITRAPSTNQSVSCVLEVLDATFLDPDGTEIPPEQYDVEHGNYEYVSRGIPPIPPMYIYGYVFVNGGTAPQGFNVSARVSTTLVDSGLTNATGYYGPLEISVEVYGGQTVSLYVQQFFVQNETVRSGIYQIDLRMLAVRDQPYASQVFVNITVWSDQDHDNALIQAEFLWDNTPVGQVSNSMDIHVGSNTFNISWDSLEAPINKMGENITVKVTISSLEETLFLGESTFTLTQPDRELLWTRLTEVILTWPNTPPEERDGLWDKIVKIVMLYPDAP